jgi:membrane fusion protein
MSVSLWLLPLASVALPSLARVLREGRASARRGRRAARGSTRDEGFRAAFVIPPPAPAAAAHPPALAFAGGSPGTAVAAGSRGSVGEERGLPTGRGLFRPEVLAERQAQWLGSVLIAPRVSYRLFTAFGVLSAAGVVAMLLCGQYTQKARINGWLVPEAGLIQVFPPKSGVVTSVDVREGEEVKRGAPLVVLSTELRTADLGGVREDIVMRLRSQRESLLAEKDRQQALFKHQTQEMSDRLAVMKTERDHLEEQLKFGKDRLAVAQRGAARQRDLRTRGLDTVERLEAAEKDEIDQAENLQGLKLALDRLDRDSVTLKAELRVLPLKEQQQLADLDRKVAALEQQLAANEAERQIVITAPQDGTVSAIQTTPGANADLKEALLSIIPAGSKLQAQLFAPSREIGFVHAGQRVIIRYDAFPYQKFGYYEGQVVDVSRSTVNLARLPTQIAGLTGVQNASEPVYLVSVALAKQAAVAYGSTVRLQPGMQLQADVMIQTRRLVGWVLEPLFTLTGGRPQ